MNQSLNNDSLTIVMPSTTDQQQEDQTMIKSLSNSPSSTCSSESTNPNDENSIIPIPNTELDILIKMERANKEMENNHRSAQSILLTTNSINTSSPHSLSRRASFTSEVNSLKDEDTFSRMDEISWELWNQIITDWNSWSKKKPIQLKEYIRKGIPIYLRPLAWQYLCGANETDAKDKFKEYLKKQSACEKIIRRDIDRTYPDHDYFRTVSGQESLFNLMKAYSIHDPEVGYCQGSAFICGLLLIQNIPEEEAFAIFVQIMQYYELREIYKPNMYHLGLCMFQLDYLLQEQLPDLHSHFIAHAFHTSMYSSGWFLTLFTTSLPLPLVCRIFDIFLNEGIEIIFRIGLALLEFHKENLIMLDMEGMLKYFQKELPTKHETDHEGILNKAFAIKYNQKKMKKLEKDFTILKKEEQEEQVEMRRLRAENKLLKQRIDNLEKESANLAERLIKGQVTNAQNAELIYILKNETQKLKDKINEMQIESDTASEQNRIKLVEHTINSSEMELLQQKIGILLEENTRLRETPDNQRLEDELIQIKMRDAESQLAIKELQKTIHVLNLEYQEFLNNRSAAIASLNATPLASVSNQALFNRPEYQVMEEELLKVKMREAETQSEMKTINFKIMQLETEKQVAYNQIKRQDEEIRSLNAQIYQIQHKELDSKSQLTENRRQLDDKEAQLKELKMTHKLQELEDAHVIAELRQRVASLEVQIQEFVTTGQLNDNEKNFYMYQQMSGSSISLADFNFDDKIKHLLMSSNTSLQQVDKMNLLRTKSNKVNSTSILNSLPQLSSTTPSTPTTTILPVIPNDELSSSMASIPQNVTKSKAVVNRSRSEDSTHESDLSRLNATRVKIGTSSADLHTTENDTENIINDKSSPLPNLNSESINTSDLVKRPTDFTC